MFVFQNQFAGLDTARSTKDYLCAGLTECLLYDDG